jgi:hypothetical protein
LAADAGRSARVLDPGSLASASARADETAAAILRATTAIAHRIPATRCTNGGGIDTWPLATSSTSGKFTAGVDVGDHFCARFRIRTSSTTTPRAVRIGNRAVRMA